MYGATDEEYEKIERIVYDDPRAYGAVWYPKKVLESVYEFMRAYPKQEIERKIGEADEKRKTKISRLSTYLGMNISDIIGMLFGSVITLVGMRYGWADLPFRIIPGRRVCTGVPRQELKRKKGNRKSCTGAPGRNVLSLFIP